MKKPTVARLKKEADRLYSIKLRQSASNSRGFVKCYTCSVTKNWKEMQCGHYEYRSHNATRFYEKNTKVQCVGCNVFKQGNMPAYALALIEKYGPGILAELSREKQKIKQFSVPELRALIVQFSLSPPTS